MELLLESFRAFLLSQWKDKKEVAAAFGIAFQWSLSQLEGKSEMKKAAEPGAGCICHFELRWGGGWGERRG